MESTSKDSSSHHPSLPFPSLPFPSLLLPSLIFLFLLLLLPSQQATISPNRTPHLRPRVTAAVNAERHSNSIARVTAPRQRRQSRPREGIFRTYWRLATEASNDTGSAFSQIRDLFSTLIEPSNGRSENIQSVGNATLGAETTTVADEGSGEGGNVTTTTTEAPPRRISTGELMTIFRRNVFGLGRLFGREFWNAIQQSNKNVEMYMGQWRDALKPYFQ